MVFFTCQHCGSSLKKNVVEKHYMTECRNRNPNLTCVDCLKDFLGNAYVAHTSCLTEDEKYSAKGFKSKPPSDKGAKKQNSWMNSIQETKVLPTMNAFQKRLIHRCQNSPNVPQKRIKFQNFCKSVFGKFADINQINEVFDIFEKAHKASSVESITKTVSNAEPTGNAGNNDRECNSNGITVDKDEKRLNSDTMNGDGDVETTTETESSSEAKQKLSKKEKKELKRKAKLAAKLNENANEYSMEMENSVNLENYENENTENDMNHEVSKEDLNMDIDKENLSGEMIQNSGEGLSKKERKKLKKQEKYQAELNQIESVKASDIQDEESADESNRKAHKKKKRKNEENGVVENGNENKRPKKRNRDCVDMDVDEEQVVKKSRDIDSCENGDSNATELNKPKFNWEEIIVQILQSRKDQELPIKRLAKKVITEYQANYATYETFEKISAKFHKKVKKIPHVKVLHEKVKLITDDE